ncbi:hypothetical protein GCM10012275_38180 [Longimycelium tulufanense]|uniref:Peptidoglycan recognition protein family domain-containing protein n=1 Tax=Longimycelium tulufanense TaxID=907463 RepID=A0A8J3FW71_9PSEU|nr:N-acetylmuramoyl-L-alanine amidase [Longimycelium tulufanense]GGM63999.1 hypothetical protein GCM10012275_38180 [Longimycelium tulufanense]
MRIIPRSAWGAQHPNGCGLAPLPATEVWLHHSVTAPTISMRELEEIGHRRFGCGISYTWVVYPDGRICEGHSIGRQGTHTAGRNDRGRAVCLVGNYDLDRPTEAQIDAVAWLLRHAHAQGWITAPRLSGGHRDVYPTACPGHWAYQAIPEINHRATEADDMFTDDDRRRLAELHEWWQHGIDGIRHAGDRYLKLVRIEQQLAAVPPVDPRAVADALRPDLTAVVREVLGTDNADQADAIVDKLAERLGRTGVQQ